jgi:uncharacterized membrane protein YedE/YeeE
MENFTPISALIGGVMIGASAVLFMLLHGRVAGISGILGGLLNGNRAEFDWRLSFLIGLILAPLVMVALNYPIGDIAPQRDYVWMIVAGLLVGVGTRLGGGCTSGHGICGSARLSPRSITATVTFVLVAMITFATMNQIIGG